MRAMAIHKELFGTLQDGRSVHAYTLTNHSDVSLRVMDLGATVLNLWIRGVDGNQTDVVCGYDSPLDYLACGGYQGAVIGRVANRIAGASFVLDGRTYNLYPNEGGNHLHGGQYGFDRRMWNCEIQDSDAEPSLVMKYESADGEEGYPGTLSVTVTYTLLSSGGVSVRYTAEADQPTVLNLTNHSYFNLGGYAAGNIGTHTLKLDADRINVVGEGMIPDGTFRDVTGTAFDFREEKRLADSIFASDPMIREAGGIDHNYVFCEYDGGIRHRIALREPLSGLCMDVYTDQPCVQVYTANMIDVNDRPFKDGVPQKKHCAVCLETQSMPDSIHHSGFTNTVLRPGERYDRTTVFAFSYK